MIEVPTKFRPHINTSYPESNHIPFEEWFWMQNIPDTKREYLGVFFTSYYVNSQYGQNKVAIDELQVFLNSLDTSKSYYTICQYDDCILNDISHLDIKIFGMSRRFKEQRIDEVVPLLSQPTPHRFSEQKIYEASFVGNLTHPIRQEMIAATSGKNGYYISTGKHGSYDYHKILSQSKFALCPRGYGSSSFRQYEAMLHNCVPVYITDDVLAPYGIDFNEYGVVIDAKDVGDTCDILAAISEDERQKKLSRMVELRNDYFTFEGCAYQIIKNVMTE